MCRRAGGPAGCQGGSGLGASNLEAPTELSPSVGVPRSRLEALTWEHQLKEKAQYG